MALPVVRPLVVATRFAVGESLVGAIAASTRANVLRHPHVILDEVGLALSRPGMVGQELGDLAPRLAAKLGCEVQDIVERLHPYVCSGTQPAANGSGNWAMAVRWGSGALQRQHLDLRNRRISPKALSMAGHHRAHWLNLLLPYCVETLERLVDACDSCGAKLGWRTSWGIEVCETCRATVCPSPDPVLGTEHATGYRAFAAVVSPSRCERDAAIETLAPELRALSPTSLVNTVLGLGRALPFLPDEAASSNCAVGGTLPMAVHVARGMELLAHWPARLRNAISHRLAEADRDAAGAGGSMPVLLRRLGDIRSAPADQAALVREAIPEAFERLNRAFALSGPVTLASDLARQAGISIDQVRTLENQGAIEGVETRKGDRTYRQYPKSACDRIIALWRGSERCTRLEQRLTIPRYAVEQLARLGEVTPETSRAATILDPTLRLKTDSVEALIAELDSRMRDDPAPDDALPLGSVTSTVGGRLKPWGELIGLLRRGRIPFWLLAGVAQPYGRSRWTRCVSVRPGDLVDALTRRADPVSHQEFIMASEISQLDACEILNCQSHQMQAAVDAGDLAFTVEGLRYLTSLPTTLAFAARTIAVPELAFLLGLSVNDAVKMMDRRNERRASIGWPRETIRSRFGDLLEEASLRRRVGIGFNSRGVMTDGHARVVNLALSAGVDCPSKVG